MQEVLRLALGYKGSYFAIRLKVKTLGDDKGDNKALEFLGP